MTFEEWFPRAITESGYKNADVIKEISAEVWSAAIEEAAKLCERHGAYTDYVDEFHWCAKDIRELK